MSSAVAVQTKGFWLQVVGRDVIVDGGDEFVHVLEYAAPDALLGNLRKPPLHLIEPGTAGRREVQVVARSFLEPRCDLRRLVRGIVIQHQMDVPACGHGAFNLIQEAQELLLSVLFLAPANDFARCDVERGKERGGAVAVVIMGPPLGLPRPHG